LQVQAVESPCHCLNETTRANARARAQQVVNWLLRCRTGAIHTSHRSSR